MTFSFGPLIFLLVYLYIAGKTVLWLGDKYYSNLPAYLGMLIFFVGPFGLVMGISPTPN